MKQGLRWGVLGAGEVVKKHVAEAVAGTNRRFVGLWSPSGSGSALAASWGGLAYQDPADLICACDAIYVATPVSSHVPLAEAVVSANRHAVIEKPLSAGLGDLARLRVLVRSRGAHVETAYYRRYAPWFCRLKELVTTQALGHVRAANWRFSFPYEGLHDTRPPWRLQPSLSGGGVVADAGCHRIDLLVQLFGMPERTAVSGVARASSGVETSARVELRWQSGIEADCRFDWSSQSQDALRLELEGGSITVALNEGPVLVVQRDRARTRYLCAAAANPIEPLLAAFEERVRANSPPLPQLDADIAVDEVVSGILQQVRTA